jgi:hypothetical protein
MAAAGQKDQAEAGETEAALRGSGSGLPGRGFVVLLLRLLFLFRHLLLLVLFLVFLPAFVSHACSFFSDCDLKPGPLRG